ncbi:MAG: hypothetical protein RI947_632, partial [Candidatus Parcubacteria bacterium]
MYSNIFFLCVNSVPLSEYSERGTQANYRTFLPLKRLLSRCRRLPVLRGQFGAGRRQLIA